MILPGFITFLPLRAASPATRSFCTGAPSAALRCTPKALSDEKARAEAAEDMVLKDLQAMRAKEKADSGTAPKTDSASPLNAVKETVKTALVANFFLVVAILVALVIGLGAHAAGDDRILDLWLPLWQPVFQPVLGTLMLGTIVQGTISYIESK